MLINQEDVKQTKEFIEIMQAFTDGKEIEFKPDSFKGIWKQTTAPTWDFCEYKYRIKPSEPEVFIYPIYKQSKRHGTIFKFTGLDSGEYMTKTSSFNIGDYNNNLVKHTDNKFWKDYTPEYVYPIYKRLKNQKETIVEFTGLDSGIYVSTHNKSIYRPGYPALNMAPHTDSSWEDCTVSINAEKKIILNNSTTIELFEVISYCDITEEYSIRKQLYKDEELEELQHYQKTGRSLIIDKDTRQIIKVNHN